MSNINRDNNYKLVFSDAT